MSYIQNSDKGKVCVFCRAQEVEDGLENLIVHRSRYTYVILNRYPYTSGHLMVVPFEHIALLDDLPPEATTEMMDLITQCIKILRDEYNAQGFNVGANIGSAAGAGIPKHFHFHIVPRWAGDTNFLSSIGETRLLPEALEDTYHRVKKGWERLSAERKGT
jgi:ATP adenylyltransferase